MGFIRNILNKIFGSSNRISESLYADRIESLHKLQADCDKDIRNIITQKIDLSWYRLSINKTKHNSSKVFAPRELGKIKTMKELLRARKKAEEEKKRLEEERILKAFVRIDNYLIGEDENNASSLFYSLRELVKDSRNLSNNKYLIDKLAEYESKITDLREVLEQRRLEQLKKERKEREEKLQREREAQRIAEEKAECKRLETERIAREYEEKLRQEYEKIETEIKRLTPIVTQKKDNYQAFINHLRLHGVHCFYHFTDVKNIRSIKKYGGLYSWYYCSNNDIAIPNPGGDSGSRKLDEEQGLADYVRLSFCSDHPMAYRKKKEGAHNVLLQIKIDVAAFKDTQFSNVNAAANDNKHGSQLEDLLRVNISATQETYVRSSSAIFHEHQAECMVKTFIPLDYIINIDEFD